MIILTTNPIAAKELAYKMSKTMEMCGLKFKPLNIKIVSDPIQIKGMSLHGKMVLSMNQSSNNGPMIQKLEQEAMLRGAEVWRVDDSCMREAAHREHGVSADVIPLGIT